MTVGEGTCNFIIPLLQLHPLLLSHHFHQLHPNKKRIFREALIKNIASMFLENAILRQAFVKLIFWSKILHVYRRNWHFKPSSSAKVNWLQGDNFYSTKKGTYPKKKISLVIKSTFYCLIVYFLIIIFLSLASISSTVRVEFRQFRHESPLFFYFYDILFLPPYA